MAQWVMSPVPSLKFNIWNSHGRREPVPTDSSDLHMFAMACLPYIYTYTINTENKILIGVWGLRCCLLYIYQVTEEIIYI